MIFRPADSKPTAYFVYVEERQRGIGGKDTEKER